MNLVDTLFQLAPSPGLLLLIIAVIALVESLALVGLLVPGVVLMTAAASWPATRSSPWSRPSSPPSPGR